MSASPQVEAVPASGGASGNPGGGGGGSSSPSPQASRVNRQPGPEKRPHTPGNRLAFPGADLSPPDTGQSSAQPGFL